MALRTKRSCRMVRSRSVSVAGPIGTLGSHSPRSGWGPTDLDPSHCSHDAQDAAVQNGQFPGLGSSMRLAAPFGTSEVT
jgi:hypothetical protein